MKNIWTVAVFALVFLLIIGINASACAPKGKIEVKTGTVTDIRFSGSWAESRTQLVFEDGSSFLFKGTANSFIIGRKYQITYTIYDGVWVYYLKSAEEIP